MNLTSSSRQILTRLSRSVATTTRGNAPESSLPRRPRKTSPSRFKYGSLVTAICTRRYPPPSCHHIKLRNGGGFYTDFGKITHRAITRLRSGSVIRVGQDLASCHVLFHETRREDFFDARINFKAKRSRRFVHPYDLTSLCSVVGVQAGSRVLEVGVDYGHLTLLLSDLVGHSGHVVATSKNPIPAEVKTLIADWLRREGCDEERGGSTADRFSNVSLHSFDVSDIATARRQIASVVASKPVIDRMDFTSPLRNYRSDEGDVDAESNAVGNDNDDKDVEGDDVSAFGSSNLLDAVFALKLPEAATRDVVEAAAPLLRCGGAIGVIPLDFSHLRSLADFVHRRRLPFFLEVVRQPQTHRFHPSLEEAETAVEAPYLGKGGDPVASASTERPYELGHDYPSEEKKGEGKDAEEEEKWIERRKGISPFSPMGFPKDLRSENYWPRSRLLWSGRQYEAVWLAKFVKVSDFEFVARAESYLSDAMRGAEAEERQRRLAAEIVERFPWNREMEAEVEELRTKLRVEILEAEKEE